MAFIVLAHIVMARHSYGLRIYGAEWVGRRRASRKRYLRSAERDVRVQPRLLRHDRREARRPVGHTVQRGRGVAAALERREGVGREVRPRRRTLPVDEQRHRAARAPGGDDERVVPHRRLEAPLRSNIRGDIR